MKNKYRIVESQVFEAGRTINIFLCDCKKCTFLNCPKRNYSPKMEIVPYTPKEFYDAMANDIKRLCGKLTNYGIVAEFFDVCIADFPKGTYWEFDEYSLVINLVKLNKKGKVVKKGSISPCSYLINDIDLTKAEEELAKVIVKNLKGIYKEWAAAEYFEEHSPYGWLSTDGRFYGCKFAEHSKLAKFYLGSTEETLECTGWAKITYGGIAFGNRRNPENGSMVLCSTFFTAEQRSWLIQNGFILDDDDIRGQ